ncbi:MAG: hypothetical protein AB1656_15295 [Candidatus Omnitrophota bacterium]
MKFPLFVLVWSERLQLFEIKGYIASTLKVLQTIQVNINNRVMGVFCTDSQSMQEGQHP